VHSAHRSFRGVESKVGLRDYGLEAVRFEFVLTERAGEESALVHSRFQIYDISAAQFRLCKNHLYVAD
jgi:hypothetical protein